MQDYEINIPPEVRNRYIERRRQDLASLQAALSLKSFEEFKRIGHQLKGNAASFGYPELEKVAVKMEQAGENLDAFEASRQLQALKVWLENVGPN